MGPFQRNVEFFFIRRIAMDPKKFNFYIAKHSIILRKFIRKKITKKT